MDGRPKCKTPNYQTCRRKPQCFGLGKDFFNMTLKVQCIHIYYILILEYLKLKRLITTSIDKEVDKLELSYTIGKYIKWKTVRQFLKLNAQLPYDTTIPVLRIYPREIKSSFPYKDFNKCSQFYL